jgi:hypothetical protein
MDILSHLQAMIIIISLIISLVKMLEFSTNILETIFCEGNVDKSKTCFHI